MPSLDHLIPFVLATLVFAVMPGPAIFYIAFLPQFVDPAAAAPVWLQFLLLGVIVNLAFSAMDLATVLLTSSMLRRVRDSGLGEKLLRWLGGSILIALGARLAISER